MEVRQQHVRLGDSRYGVFAKPQAASKKAEPAHSPTPEQLAKDIALLKNQIQEFVSTLDKRQAQFQNLPHQKEEILAILAKFENAERLNQTLETVADRTQAQWQKMLAAVDAILKKGPPSLQLRDMKDKLEVLEAHALFVKPAAKAAP